MSQPTSSGMKTPCVVSNRKHQWDLWITGGLIFYFSSSFSLSRPNRVHSIADSKSVKIAKLKPTALAACCSSSAIFFEDSEYTTMATDLSNGFSLPVQVKRWVDSTELW